MPQNDGEVRVEITGDSSKIKKELKETKSAVKNTADSISEMTSALEDISRTGDNFNDVAESVNNVAESAGNAADAVSDTADEVNNLGDSIKNAGDKTITFGDLLKANLLSDAIQKGIGKLANGFANFIKQGVSLASDLQEVQNVVDTTFGDGAEQIYSWSDAAAESFGMSSLQAQNFNGTLGAMLKSMGLADDAVLKMSTDMVGLAGDMASFYNLDVDLAFEKIRAGISGETEPLKQLGINMSVANLEAYALAQGIETAYDKMSQSEQAILRYNYLMSVTADAQGDFAKTSDSFANQQRILELQTQNLAASFGEKLLPMVNDLTGSLNENMPQIGEKIDTVGNIVVGLFDFVIDNHETILSVITGIGAALAAQKGAKVVGDVTSAVKDLFSTVKSGQGVMSALAAFLNTQPWVLAVGAIAAVTAGLVALASQAFKTSTALKDAAEESVQAYEDEKTKVAELEAELDGVNQKIDDIKSKGKLSFTEAEELANLKLQNGELSTQLEIEKKILETKKRQAEYDLYNAVTNEDTAEEGTIAYIEDRIQAYEEAADCIKTLQEELNEAIANGNELLAEDLREKMRPFEEAATEEELRIEESTAALNKLAENLDLTTESGREAKAAVDDLVKKVSEMFDITESEKELISSDIMDPYAADSALSATGKYFETQGKLAVEAAEKEKAAREQDLKDYVAALDEKQDLRRISEEEYYDELYGYLIAHENRESVEWFKQLSRYEDYQQKQTDAAVKAAEKTKSEQDKLSKEQQEAEKKRISDSVTALKDCLEADKNYTEEMYYNDLEALIGTLDKESELYKKFNSEILKGRRKLADDEEKRLLDEQNKTVESGLSEILKTYQKAFDELEKKRESYRKKLMTIGGDLFSVDTVKDKSGKKKTVYTVNNLNEQLRKMKEYHTQVSKLKKQGASEALLSELTSLGDEDSAQFAKYISGMSSAEFDRINALYNEKQKLADELANDLYASEAKKLSSSMIKEIAAVSEPSAEYGKEAADSYIDAFKAEFEERSGEFAELFENTDIAAEVKATVETEISRYSAAAFTAPAVKSSTDTAASENNKNYIAELIKEINKPVQLVIDGKVVSEIVIGYQNNFKKQTGG